TKMDKTLIVNFEPLGACSASNGAPCTAPVLDWTNVTDGITLGGNELLLENSELPCTLGGTVKIFYSLAAATAALPPQEEENGFWDNAWDFTKGLGTGLWKGAKGTVTGVADLVVWAGKHTVAYQLMNPAGHAEQLKKDKETFAAIGNMAVKAGTFVYRNSAINALTDPGDYMAAQAESAEMAEQMMDKAANMSAEEWGDFTGQVLFEVLMEVGTAGGAAALTAAKVADKTIDAARVLDKLDDLGDAAKAADKLEDISDGTKLLPPPKELGDVVHKLDDVVPDPPGTFRDKNGKLHNDDGTFAKDSKAQKNQPKKESEVPTGKRPSWRQSEKDIAKDHPGYSEQKSYKDRKEVPYGTEGSTRPDLYKDGHSVEIKNYDVESSAGKNNLKREINRQYEERVKHLPEGTKQTVQIDVRGQNVSAKELKELSKTIKNNSKDLEVIFKMK
ncbi:PAAR-like protein, partial [uncultured Zobellia sp.]|uniref:PAAR-like protein n=1 Tax=uncultured Zobellia sp. TaxID=255433 RepID=UPI00259841D2